MVSTVGGAFVSWLNAYVVHDEEEEIESVIAMAMVVCLAVVRLRVVGRS